MITITGRQRGGLVVDARARPRARAVHPPQRCGGYPRGAVEHVGEDRRERRRRRTERRGDATPLRPHGREVIMVLLFHVSL